MKGRKEMALYKEICRERKMKVVHMIKKRKTDFYKERLSKASGDQKDLFTRVNELLNCTMSSALSFHSSKTDLADDMANFLLY